MQRDARFGTACAVLCLSWSLLGSAALGRVGRDRPPPAHTGGFSEPLCTTCHFQAAVNTGTGSITIDGLPHEYEPGASYTLTITVAQASLTAGGFQLSSRFEDGSQAGSLRAATTDETRTDVTVHEGVQYIHHVYAGTRAVSPDTARWQIIWTAPPASDAGERAPASHSASHSASRGAAAVIFHFAGNAADDDESPLGDMIYAASARTVPGK
jgi:hypothetical protein